MLEGMRTFERSDHPSLRLAPFGVVASRSFSESSEERKELQIQTVWAVAEPAECELTIQTPQKRTSAVDQLADKRPHVEPISTRQYVTTALHHWMLTMSHPPHGRDDQILACCQRYTALSACRRLVDTSTWSGKDSSSHKSNHRSAIVHSADRMLPKLLNFA